MQPTTLTQKLILGGLGAVAGYGFWLVFRRPGMLAGFDDSGVRFLIHKKTKNIKLSNIPVVITSRTSCAKSCAWYEVGCYGATGHLCGDWRRTQIKGKYMPGMLKFVSTLEPDDIWRFGVIGDLPGRGDEIDVGELRQIIRAAQAAGTRGYAYTHKPVLFGPHAAKNREIIKEANDYVAKSGHGLTINLSANTLEHADKLMALGIAPVAVVQPEDMPDEKQITPSGYHVSRCPAQTQKTMTCARCRICLHPTRKAIVGLAAHGGSKRFVSAISRGETVYLSPKRKWVKPRESRDPKKAGKIIKQGYWYISQEMKTAKQLPHLCKVGRPVFATKVIPTGQRISDRVDCDRILNPAAPPKRHLTVIQGLASARTRRLARS